MTRSVPGSASFEAVPVGEVAKREKANADAYAQALKAYKDAKTADPSAPAPMKTTITVLEKSVSAKDKAEALAAKYREKYEQAKKAQ